MQETILFWSGNVKITETTTDSGTKPFLQHADIGYIIPMTKDSHILMKSIAKDDEQIENLVLPHTVIDNTEKPKLPVEQWFNEKNISYKTISYLTTQTAIPDVMEISIQGYIGLECTFPETDSSDDNYVVVKLQDIPVLIKNGEIRDTVSIFFLEYVRDKYYEVVSKDS